MERREYGADTKAAVMAALLEGQSVSTVAKQYRIPASTIRNWKAGLDLKDSVGHKKKEAIGELLLEYVRENVITLLAQLEAFRDPKWLRKQSASEVAVLHGVLMDKEARLLELMNHVPDDQPS